MLQAALLGHIRGIVTDPDGVIINMGRTRRCFTGSARIAAKLLATHCDHPGCVFNAEYAQIDHVHEYADGGATDQDNGRPECGGHNRAKHRLKMTARRDPTGKWINTDATAPPYSPSDNDSSPNPNPTNGNSSDKDSDPTPSPTCHHHASPNHASPKHETAPTIDTARSAAPIWD